MNDLALALTNVRARIAKFGGQWIGEENTKHALIEPVLRALGWDLGDLDEVRCEYKLKQTDNPVDYALFVHGGLRLLVEAKALGENLSKYAHQIMGYAGVAGIVEWIVLTDGNEYRIYNVYAPVPIDQKLFKRVVVASDEPGLTDTLGLLSKAQLQGTVIDDLWRAYFVDRQVKQAVQDLAGLDAPTDFVNLVRNRVPALSPAEVRQSLGRATLSLDYGTLTLAPTLPVGAKAPVSPPATVPPAVKDVGDKDPGPDKTSRRHVTLKDLISSGTIRPPLDIETAYKGHQLTARIEADGTVTWNGAAYGSLSTAGGMALKSIVGAPPGREYPSTNGWTFWRFRDADGRLAFLDVLRQFPVASAPTAPAIPAAQPKAPPTVPSPVAASAAAKWGDGAPWRGVSLGHLIDAGLVRVPLDLERHYKGAELTARIEGASRVVFAGQPYGSLSRAAGMARKSIVGSRPRQAYPQTNGWTFWQYRRTDGTLGLLDDLRREFHERKVVSLVDARRTGQ